MQTDGHRHPVRRASPACSIVELQTFGDERGFFVETYRREWFPGAREMIQGNRGDRQAGCVVGLHYHLHQADYWYVPFGPRPGGAARPAGRFAHRRRHRDASTSASRPTARTSTAGSSSRPVWRTGSPR